MGKFLGQLAPLVFWNFTPEQVQNPDKLAEYLEEVCCHPRNSRETQIIAMCWGLAHAYRAQFNTVQCSKGEAGGNKVTDSAVSPAPATSSAATLVGTADVTAPRPTLLQPPWRAQWLLHPW